MHKLDEVYAIGFISPGINQRVAHEIVVPSASKNLARFNIFLYGSYLMFERFLMLNFFDIKGLTVAAEDRT
jgi:hypothetical protein